MNFDIPLFKLIQRPLLPIQASWVDATPLLLLLAVILFAVWASRRLQRHQLARRVIQVFSFFFMVILVHRCLCALRGWVFGLQLIGRNDLIAFGHMCVFMILAAVGFAYGRHFCGWVCPVGFLQEVLGVVPRLRARLPYKLYLAGSYVLLVGSLLLVGRLAWDFRPTTQYWSENVAGLAGLALLAVLFVALPGGKLERKLRALKYVAALAWLVLATAGVFVTNPWCNMYGNEMDYSSLLALSAVLAGALVLPNAWCRYMCPLGGMLAVCARTGRYRPHPPKVCYQCGECDKVCPTGALNAGEIDYSSCIYCGACLDACGYYWEDTYTGLPAEGQEAQANKAHQPPASSSNRTGVASVLLVLALGATLFLGLPARAGEVVEWPTFHFDNGRTGNVPVDFPSANFKLKWSYYLGEHTWTYCEGASVWSSSPVVANIEGRMLVITGAYDHNVYALDLETGRRVWRFTTGCLLNAAPAFARIRGMPLVFIGSGDRVFYALKATNGQKLWAYETMPWTFTVGDSAPTDPLVAMVQGKPLVFVGFWNSDRRSGRTIQRGELFAFEADSGRLVWRKQLTTGHLSDPALLKVEGRQLLFIGTEDGVLFALDAATGREVWRLTTSHAITNSPVATYVAKRPVVYIGNFFGMLRCLQAGTGETIWKTKLGHELRSTPALSRLGDLPALFIGSVDRRLYALEAKSTRVAWQFQTGKYITASPVAFNVAHKPAIAFASEDNNLYVLDAITGQELWRFTLGNMLWSYEKRAASYWSSPAVVSDGKRPLLLFGGHDGKFYCFEATTAPVSQVPAATKRKSVRAPWLVLLGKLQVALGVVLVVVGLAMSLLPLVLKRRQA